MRTLFLTLAAALGLQLAAADVLWKADFDKQGELAWKKIRANAADSFVTGNGVLTAACSALGKKVNTGVLYETALPDVERGALYFEVLPNAGNAPRQTYDHLSLLIRFNGRLVSLRPGWWTHYFVKSGNRRLAAIPAGKWLSFKIEFDRKAKTISYFFNDMTTPVWVEKDVEFKGPVKFQFGNYGLTSGPVVNHIRNVRLEKAEDASDKVRSGAVILRGIDFDAYDIDGILREFSIGEKPVFCDVAIKTGLLMKNEFYLTKNPLFARTRPALIVMADFPLNGTLSADDLDELVSEVKNGAQLIVLGGMFTLNKGEFRHAAFNKILPVRIAAPWDIAYDKDNFSVRGAEGAVALYQTCPLTEGAQALLSVGNAPLLSGIRCGSGAVAVYTGIPGGRRADKGEMIHRQKTFPKLLKKSLACRG
ncbi:MAG: hypothetical protein IJU70_03030 [Lentisphaeria bacterium]|nr:hypothetical protein [Lentisphaeria bacterium]